MDKIELEQRIIERGRAFFSDIGLETPSIFNPDYWTGKVLDWAMRHEHFKVQLFRFVDVLPYLKTGGSLNRHFEEYFTSEPHDLPRVFKWSTMLKGIAGEKLTTAFMARTIRGHIEKMAKQFIIGENSKEAIKTLNRLRKENYSATMDILGEATVSEDEAQQYQQQYLAFLDALGEKQDDWPSLGNSSGDLDWGHAPKINLAIKPTTLFSQANPADFEGSVQGICNRFVPILKKAAEIGAFVCIDMEQYRYKDITIEVYSRLRSMQEFRDYPHLGLALQSYLQQTDADLDNLLAWAREENLPISIRLVKGAYWDYETVIARQNGWEIPVYLHKAEADAAFERQAQRILENYDICHLACASHNIRTIAAVLEAALAMAVPVERYEFQALYGMAEPVRKTLLKHVGRVRLYCPYGELLPGMAYLVRRLLENTSNESFLRQSFAEETETIKLLEDPLKTLLHSQGAARTNYEKSSAKRILDDEIFHNEPLADFTKTDIRAAFPEAIAQVRSKSGQTYPLLMGGERIETDDVLNSINPADPSEIIGAVCQAGTAEIEQAIEKAQSGLPEWRDTSSEERARYLFRAADIARTRKILLSAWQVLEVGKQWDQAYADITEAIDFLEYYGREMIRLGNKRKMGHLSGELNQYFYQPKGVAAIIAPWNFPFAISCGMCAAAMVAGNCVLYKPSGLSSVNGYLLAELFEEAGIPPGVFNFTPGRSSVMGDFLVEHPTINLIAFTGSMEVGLRITEKAAKVVQGQSSIKKVITEMGGKNAIIVDDDADLDEAVKNVLSSAFGFQGQKCSACSRVIVLEGVYDRFVKRLVAAAQSIAIGPAEDPKNYMGPVVDGAAQEKIRKYIAIGKQEGTLLLEREIPQDGYYVPLTIFTDIKPEHRLAQEEIFGPVLSILKAKTFTEALDIANSTQFALTGGVFSRSPNHLEMAGRLFQVGNLYLNRGTTGALVGRQPFGGFKMSGIGSKAGGPDYLHQFMDPIVVTENTMRRGFAPVEE